MKDTIHYVHCTLFDKYSVVACGGSTREEFTTKNPTEVTCGNCKRTTKWKEAMKMNEKSKITEPESYLKRQNEWIKENDVKVGDEVKVLRIANEGENGWPTYWAMDMLTVGDVSKIDRFSYAGCILGDEYVYPFFVLEKVVKTEPEFTLVSRPPLPRGTVISWGNVVYSVEEDTGGCEGVIALHGRDYKWKWCSISIECKIVEWPYHLLVYPWYENKFANGLPYGVGTITECEVPTEATTSVVNVDFMDEVSEPTKEPLTILEQLDEICGGDWKHTVVQNEENGKLIISEITEDYMDRPYLNIYQVSYENELTTITIDGEVAVKELFNILGKYLRDGD
jgi:hypothetical protein